MSKKALAKVNPSTWGFDTPAHEVFHIYFRDMLDGPSKIRSNLAKKAIRSLAASRNSEVVAKILKVMDENPGMTRTDAAEEVLTNATVEESIWRALGEDNGIKNAMKDVWSNIKARFGPEGSATLEDLQRLYSNKLVYDAPTAERYTGELPAIARVTPMGDEEAFMQPEPEIRTITRKRKEDFETSGIHQYYEGDKLVAEIYRDPESGYWYDGDDQSFIGFTREIAEKKLNLSEAQIKRKGLRQDEPSIKTISEGESKTKFNLRITRAQRIGSRGVGFRTWTWFSLPKQVFNTRAEAEAAILQFAKVQTKKDGPIRLGLNEVKIGNGQIVREDKYSIEGDKSKPFLTEDLLKVQTVLPEETSQQKLQDEPGVKTLPASEVIELIKTRSFLNEAPTVKLNKEKLISNEQAAKIWEDFKKEVPTGPNAEEIKEFIKDSVVKTPLYHFSKKGGEFDFVDPEKAMEVGSNLGLHLGDPFQAMVRSSSPGLFIRDLGDYPLTSVTKKFWVSLKNPIRLSDGQANNVDNGLAELKSRSIVSEKEFNTVKDSLKFALTNKRNK